MEGFCLWKGILRARCVRFSQRTFWATTINRQFSLFISPQVALRLLVVLVQAVWQYHIHWGCIAFTLSEVFTTKTSVFSHLHLFVKCKYSRWVRQGSWRAGVEGEIWGKDTEWGERDRCTQVFSKKRERFVLCAPSIYDAQFLEEIQLL